MLSICTCDLICHDLSGVSPLLLFFLDIAFIEGSLIRGSFSLSALESLYRLNVKVVDSSGGAS